MLHHHTHSWEYRSKNTPAREREESEQKKKRGQKVVDAARKSWTIYVRRNKRSAEQIYTYRKFSAYACINFKASLASTLIIDLQASICIAFQEISHSTCDRFVILIYFSRDVICVDFTYFYHHPICSSIKKKRTRVLYRSTHTSFCSIRLLVIDGVKKKNVGRDHYKVHQEPITCFYNQKKKKWLIKSS